MAHILIIDDDMGVCVVLTQLAARAGEDASYALTLKEGLRKAHSERCDIVLLDIHLPDGNGLDALPRIRNAASSPEVIIITGEGDPDSAELAIKSGAWDYIQKPFSNDAITLTLNRALQYRREKGARRLPVALRLDGIVGSSPRMRHCFDLVARAGDSESNVLITGETGTGKELFARALHENSGRAGKDFVVVDCAALPETLIESSLFGHEKGAFTGAVRAEEGLIRMADGGTLFLDEVGELDIGIQKAFLRVLQERRYRPVGGKRELRSDFRLISATNKDLDQMAESGRFRKDLLYRIRTISIELPPLRDRMEDLGALTAHHVMKICSKYGMEIKGFSPDFFEALQGYDWPGNVRELINVLEESISKAKGEPILIPQHLPTALRINLARSLAGSGKENPPSNSTPARPGRTPIPEYGTFREIVLADAEKKYFRDLIEYTRGDLQEACRISRLGRSRLYAILKRHGLSRSGWPSK
ncbi:MAG: sigma-54 dependent transcriptional regulator [Thermodesulfobacteriota bacterium]